MAMFTMLKSMTLLFAFHYCCKNCIHLLSLFCNFPQLGAWGMKGWILSCWELPKLISWWKTSEQYRSETTLPKYQNKFDCIWRSSVYFQTRFQAKRNIHQNCLLCPLQSLRFLANLDEMLLNMAISSVMPPKQWTYIVQWKRVTDCYSEV